MPVKITNISDVNSFESGSVNFPIGNAGQWKTRTVDVSGGIFTESSQSNVITFKVLNPQGYYEIERIQGSWIEDGFEVGDTITIRNNNSVAGVPTDGVFSGSIIEISDLVITTDAVLNIAENVSYPTPLIGTVQRNWSIISTVKDINAIEFKFNQLDNDSVDSATMNSIYDGTQAVFIAENIDATDTITVLPMTQIGDKSGSTVINPTVKGLGVGTGTQNYLSNFRLTFTYKISGELDDINNYINDTPPTWYEANNCLTNNLFVKYKSENNNPNVSIVSDPTSDVTKKLGNTGWRNENYNGLPVNASVTSVEYRANDISGEIINEPYYNNDTFVTIIIDDPDAVVGSSKYGFQFMYAPTFNDQYKNNQFSEAQNLLINAIQEHEGIALMNTALPVSGTFQGFENSVGARMDVVDPHLVIVGTTVTLTLTLRPNSLFAAYMESQIDGNRLVNLSVSVGRPSLTPANSNRARLTVDSIQMDKLLIDRGNYPFLESKFLQHDEDENDTGNPLPYGYIMDDQKHYALIPVNKNNEFRLTGIRSEIIIEETATGNFGELESNLLDLTGYPVTNDPVLGNIIQANSGDTLRGFNLATTNNNNWFRVNRRSDLDNLNFWWLEYWYAFRIRFEDWVQATNLPEDLYVETDEINNFNQNWLNKLLSGWELKYKLFIEVEEDTTNIVTGDVTTVASTFTDTFPIDFVLDYESGDLVGDSETFNSNNDSLFIATEPDIYNKNLNGLINGETVKQVFTFTSASPIGSINDVKYAYINLYAYRQGTIFSSWQLSTAVDNLLGGNPLEPLNPSTQTTPTITLVDPNTVTVECNINSDNLPTSNDLCYAIGCRIEIDLPPFFNDKITEDDIQKITEDSQDKIIE